LFYLAADGKINAVPVTVIPGAKPSLKPGTPVPLFDAHSSSAIDNVYFNYDVKRDGKSFLVSTTGAAAPSAGSTTPPLTVRVNWNAGSKN
jgi:hypothetical protein